MKRAMLVVLVALLSTILLTVSAGASKADGSANTIIIARSAQLMLRRAADVIDKADTEPVGIVVYDPQVYDNWTLEIVWP